MELIIKKCIYKYNIRLNELDNIRESKEMLLKEYNILLKDRISYILNKNKYTLNDSIELINQMNTFHPKVVVETLTQDEIDYNCEVLIIKLSNILHILNSNDFSNILNNHSETLLNVSVKYILHKNEYVQCLSIILLNISLYRQPLKEEYDISKAFVDLLEEKDEISTLVV